jgi:4-alpha-glucanotransferase
VDLPHTSGVQLHPTSLPSGRLGPEAYAFADWLADAGQSWWQMLPLGPPDRWASPYKASSAFAGWPGLLANPDAPVSREEEQRFRERNAYWIADWERFAGSGAVADQVRFEREWTALRAYAAERGIRLIGDIPIYVAPGSADHLAHPELFQDGFVAGTPADFYTDTGQLWGNPLYDWPALQRRRYRWWIERLRHTFDMFDLARVDHFRGFVSYWAVPANAPNALAGHWKRGPGRALFDAATSQLGRGLPLIAEDLGVITPAVERLRDGLGLPGMVVLQLGFDATKPHTPHRLDNHAENRIVYTGTHDHDTIRGWYESLSTDRRAEVDQALEGLGPCKAPFTGSDPVKGALHPEPWWQLIRLAFSSRAHVAIVQAQDVLGLGSEARMNMPGTRGRSWRWRMEPGALGGDLAKRLRAATEEAGRLSPSA